MTLSWAENPAVLTEPPKDPSPSGRRRAVGRKFSIAEDITILRALSDAPIVPARGSAGMGHVRAAWEAVSLVVKAAGCDFDGTLLRRHWENGLRNLNVPDSDPRHALHAACRARFASTPSRRAAPATRPAPSPAVLPPPVVVAPGRVGVDPHPGIVTPRALLGGGGASDDSASFSGRSSPQRRREGGGKRRRAAGPRHPPCLEEGCACTLDVDVLLRGRDLLVSGHACLQCGHAVARHSAR